MEGDKQMENLPQKYDNVKDLSGIASNRYEINFRND